MARKQLIKGTNAVRVEERIARVPEDLRAQGGIFQALKALEESSSRAASRPVPAPAPSPAPSPAATARPGPAKKAKPPRAALPERRPQPAETPAPREDHGTEGPIPRRIRGLGPADFSAAERQAIVKCCADYRNHLPIYLLAVQRELEVIDSVIEKCRSVDSSRSRKRRG